MFQVRNDEPQYAFLKDKSRNASEVCFVSAVGRRMEYKNNSIDGSYLLGVSEDFQDIQSFELERGRFFSPMESQAGRNVAVIGYDIAEELFQGVDPVGKYMEVLGRKVMVIGVIVKEGTGAFDIFVLDDLAILPI